MRPVEQTSVIHPNHPDWKPDGSNAGNCMAAAIASVLELDIGEVPNFAAYPDDLDDPALDPLHEQHGCLGWRRLRRWLRTRDLDVYVLDQRTEDWRDVARELLQSSPGHGSWACAAGSTVRGTIHVVVVDDQLDVVHDPHPSDDGLEAIDEIWILSRPLDPPPPSVDDDPVETWTDAEGAG